MLSTDAQTLIEQNPQAAVDHILALEKKLNALSQEGMARYAKELIATMDDGRDASYGTRATDAVEWMADIRLIR